MTGKQMMEIARGMIAAREHYSGRPISRQEASDMLYNDTDWAGPSITAIVDQIKGEPEVYRQKAQNSC